MPLRIALSLGCRFTFRPPWGSLQIRHVFPATNWRRGFRRMTEKIERDRVRRKRKPHFGPAAGFWITVVSCLSLFLSAAEASEATPDGRTPMDGTGESYWGPIPAPSDSTQTEFDGAPRPAWEYPLLVPYRVVEFPIHMVTSGIGASYVYLENSGFIHWLGQVLGPKPIPYGAMASFKAGGLSGFGAGVSVFHNEFFGPDNRLKIRTLFTSTGEKKATLGTIYGVGHDATIEMGGGYRLRRNSRYFGLGPNSKEANESFFSQEIGWGGVTFNQVVTEKARIELSGLYSSVGTRLPHHDHSPALVDVFGGAADDLPYGYGARSEGVTWSISLVRDATDTTRRPETGSIHRFRAARFASTTDELPAQYWSYRIDLEHFIGLWFTERALAARGYLNWIDEDRDDIPFQRLLTNDEPDLFRGFRDYRWRDAGMIGASFEYRWPIWVDNHVNGVGLDAYLLSDIGQVFGDFEQIIPRRFQVSYGGGIRVIGNNDFVGRIEFAWSQEEFVFRLSSDQIFQYAGGGSFNGRDQSALR